MSYLLQLNLLFIFYSILITIINIDFVKTNNYPDVIELIGYNNRQSKMQKYPLNQQYQTQPMKKQRADIEQVKQNIEEYNKLLKIDTKKLSEQQKDMLERIVERVARLKETLDINDDGNKQTTTATQITQTTNNNDNIMMTTTTTTTTAAAATAKTSTLNTITDQTDSIINQNNDDNDDIINSSVKFINDETTFLPQTTDNIYVTTTQQTTLAGARSALTTTYQQSEEARANLNNLNKNINGNINLSTISNNNRNIVGINKSKTRYHTTTKKPISSSTKPTSKRIISTSSVSSNGHHYSRPSMKPTFSTNSPPLIQPVPAVIITTTTQQSNIGDFITTIQPKLNYNNKDIVVSTTDNHNNNNDDFDIDVDEKTVPSIIVDHHLPPVPAVQIQERTPIGGSNGGSIISSDLIYDSNVTATSIIDSLSNHAREEYYNNNKGSLSDNIKDKKPSGGTAKPTKYHYYPHNQHIYLLPECAIQQVCNAVYVRLNYTQPLCACPSRYRDPCSASLNEDDQHTTKLVGDGKKKAITLAKTCEATTEMRECRSPKDWSLLALQNTRTGKSHYLVICRCPDHFKLEGPMAHDQPTYASVPGIRVFGMMCVKPGFSIRKPSVQPPKRYQLQKPYYISNSHNNKYNLNKDNIQRPLASINSQSSNGYQQQQQLSSASNGYQNNQQHDNYQLQNQATYQYLNRPESSPIITSASHTEYPESIAINSFSTNSVSIASANSGYGRNNERNGDTPIEAEEDNTNNNNNNDNNNNSNNDNIDNDEKKRLKRSTNLNDIDNNIPEFPWDKLVEFQKTVVWDD